MNCAHHPEMRALQMETVIHRNYSLTVEYIADTGWKYGMADSARRFLPPGYWIWIKKVCQFLAFCCGLKWIKHKTISLKMQLTVFTEPLMPKFNFSIFTLEWRDFTKANTYLLVHSDRCSFWLDSRLSRKSNCSAILGGNSIF